LCRGSHMQTASSAFAIGWASTPTPEGVRRAMNSATHPRCLSVNDVAFLVATAGHLRASSRSPWSRRFTGSKTRGLLGLAGYPQMLLQFGRSNTATPTPRRRQDELMTNDPAGYGLVCPYGFTRPAHVPSAHCSSR
jgi:hypothetical protein